jgi:hypothetical protein
MKKAILIIITICLIPVVAFGNAASPYNRPGDNAVIFDDNTGIVLSEEWVKFIIDPNDCNSKVEVIYTLVNEDREDPKLEIMFLAPYFDYYSNEVYEDEFEIEVDGVEITDFEVKISREIPENWHASYSMEIIEPVDDRLLEKKLGGSRPYSNSPEVKGIQFVIDIEKGQEKELKMSYISEEGYYSFDDVVNDVFTHLYYLSPARFWNGDPVVNLEIEFPNSGYKVHSNIELEKTSSTNYGAKLTGLPDEEWTFGYVDTSGLFYGTNRRSVHNGITWSIIALTALAGIWLRKRKKFAGTLVLLGIIVELFLFRPTYGALFMVFYIVPALLLIVLAITVLVFIVKHFKKKGKTHL